MEDSLLLQVESNKAEKEAAILQINELNEKVREQEKQMDYYKSSILNLYEKIEELDAKFNDKNAFP